MRRLSIRSLMALIVVAAVGLAALRNANELWAGMLLLAAMAVVGFALMGAVILRGKARHWWAGFAFFSGAYLALSVVPWISIPFRSQLGTTNLLGHLHRRMFPPKQALINKLSLEIRIDEIDAKISQARRAVSHPDLDPRVKGLEKSLEEALILLAANKTAIPPIDEFERVGHSLLAVLAGLLGGAAAEWLYMRREKAESILSTDS